MIEKDIVKEINQEKNEEDQDIAKKAPQAQKDRIDPVHQQDNKNKKRHKANQINQRPVYQHKEAHQEHPAKDEARARMDGEDQEDYQKMEYQKPHHVTTS